MKANLDSQSVVVVDDEGLYLRLMKEDLDRRGFDVTACPDLLSGEAAFHCLKRAGKSPKLVVDLIQPGVDGGVLGGLDLLRRLSPTAEQDVVVLMDSEAEWPGQAACSLGASRVIRKPDLRRTDPEHLDQALQSFLSDRAGETAGTAHKGNTDPLRVPLLPEFFLGALEELRHAADRRTVLLLVMRLAGEMASRGILFEVEGDALCGLGCFGLQERDPAQVHGRRLPLDRDTLPGRAFWSGRLQRCGSPEVAALVPDLPGAPPREAFAQPILGRSGVVAVVYADSTESVAPQNLRTLSALAGTASMALNLLMVGAS